MGRFKILIFFMLLLLAACEEPVSPSFRQSDALLSTDLVKGKAMLDSLLTQEGLSKSEQMYGSLLRIKVKDKEYQDIKGYKCLVDSLVCYFENVKDEGILSEVYFYAGRICFENGEVPQSLQYYQKAESLVPRITMLCKVIFSVRWQTSIVFVIFHMKLCKHWIKHIWQTLWMVIEEIFFLTYVIWGNVLYIAKIINQHRVIWKMVCVKLMSTRIV